MFTRKKILGLVKIASLVAVIIVGNRFIQTYLGEQAVENTGIQVFSLKDALQHAGSHDRLVLADMSAIWCPTCRKLDDKIFANDLVKTEIEQHYVFARIEYDSKQGEEFMKKYNVSGFPNVLVLNSGGQKLAQLPLTFDPVEYQNNLKKVRQTYTSHITPKS